MHQSNPRLSQRNLKPSRAMGNYKLLTPQFDATNYEETFVAVPTDELPKNRLVEQLAKGMTLYV